MEGLQLLAVMLLIGGLGKSVLILFRYRKFRSEERFIAFLLNTMYFVCGFYGTSLGLWILKESLVLGLIVSALNMLSMFISTKYSTKNKSLIALSTMLLLVNLGIGLAYFMNTHS